ncbi:heavy metal-associated isoprenylated plant protein 3-like [Abrus precatorius]|uniref:Heavy metal-associated isoprenylated plant protein 3-like n=1 Tax=Abrus precatorius TaxID=3816 RepID=A0A8B8KUL5_ABRPR|nr:heavy metal-associated isoprenylated plant protein 3-like [Abrus precatorius]
MGAKKKTAGGNNNKENQDTNSTFVLKLDMHCDGCASKIIRHLRAFQGVETVKAESDAGKVTVTGKVDPAKVRDNLAEKLNKKVELITSQPKKKENKDTKPNNQSHNKIIKDKEVETTAVLKMALHCQGCLDRIGKTVLKTKGVKEMAIDKEKETVTVKGTMNVEALVGNLMEKLKRKVEVDPPKKDKDSDNKEGGKKKNKGGGGGDKNENEEGGEKMEQNRMEHLPPPPSGFGYGYGYGNFGGLNYVPVYPEQMHFHLHAPPPQMFSDENPNACSVM